MEACSGAHYWARELSGFGHTAKLMAPSSWPGLYRMSGKRSKSDADVICEAVPTQHVVVPIKDIDQLATLCLHRTR
jgi:transposase